MTDLDIDPFLVEDWHQYAKDCLAAGELWRFRKGLSDYIYYLNRPLEAELRAYINRRRGDFAKQDIDDDIKKSKSARYKWLAESLKEFQVDKTNLD
jgi:hypothetical protein